MVSSPLKNISQQGNLPQIRVKIKNIWNHHPDVIHSLKLAASLPLKKCWEIWDDPAFLLGAFAAARLLVLANLSLMTKIPRKSPWTHIFIGGKSRQPMDALHQIPISVDWLHLEQACEGFHSSWFIKHPGFPLISPKMNESPQKRRTIPEGNETSSKHWNFLGDSC